MNNENNTWGNYENNWTWTVLGRYACWISVLKMEFDVKGPTFVGDTIHVEIKVMESRATSRDPGRGLVKTRNHVFNQKGEVVIIYTPLRLQTGREMLAGHWQ